MFPHRLDTNEYNTLMCFVAVLAKHFMDNVHICYIEANEPS